MIAHVQFVSQKMVKSPMQSPPETDATRKIGIVAGNGTLPQKVVHACKELGYDYFTVYIQNGKEVPDYLADTPHEVLNIGAVGKAIKLFKKAGMEELVFAGGVTRPSFSSLRPDATGIKLLAQISATKFNGDNTLLATVMKFFEKAGFSFVAVNELVHDLLVPKGVLGEIAPNERDNSDIELGKKVAHTIGDLDIGQSVVVQQGVVLGVEAAEGTDNLIKRCADLQTEEERGGILVKMKKPHQDERVDLPTIGVETVVNCHKSDFCGIAIAAGAALIIDKQEVIKKADTLGLFIVGI